MGKGDLVIEISSTGQVQIINWEGTDTQDVLDFLRNLHEKVI